MEGHIGLDVHAASCTAGVIDAQGKRIGEPHVLETNAEETGFISLVQPASSAAIGIARDVVRSRTKLVAENAFLRQQLIVLQCHEPQPRRAAGRGDPPPGSTEHVVRSAAATCWSSLATPIARSRSTRNDCSRWAAPTCVAAPYGTFLPRARGESFRGLPRVGARRGRHLTRPSHPGRNRADGAVTRSSNPVRSTSGGK